MASSNSSSLVSGMVTSIPFASTASNSAGRTILSIQAFMQFPFPCSNTSNGSPWLLPWDCVETQKNKKGPASIGNTDKHWTTSRLGFTPSCHLPRGLENPRISRKNLTSLLQKGTLKILIQGNDDNLFSRSRAYIGMQAHDGNINNVLDRLLKILPGTLKQAGSYPF
ncbi:hypothetical protein SDC9_107909 [bioreactor metagenome]|uniref:Uncharacterized protein n=1 Tax=bioreactor metagenome TaxID=1076179 RepID=A0A645B6J4_9ZZZZ